METIFFGKSDFGQISFENQILSWKLFRKVRFWPVVSEKSGFESIHSGKQQLSHLSSVYKKHDFEKCFLFKKIGVWRKSFCQSSDFQSDFLLQTQIWIESCTRCQILNYSERNLLVLELKISHLVKLWNQIFVSFNVMF